MPRWLSYVHAYQLKRLFYCSCYIVETLKVCLALLETEDEKSVASNACDAVGGVLGHVGVAAMMGPLPDGKSYADHLMGHILQLLQEQAQCQRNREQDEDDEDDNHDNTLMDSVCDLIGAVAKSAGPIIVPYFDRFLDMLLRFCRASRPYTDRSMAIGCIGATLNAAPHF